MECTQGWSCSLQPQFRTLVPASSSLDPKVCCLLCGAASCRHSTMLTKKFRSLQQQALPLKSLVFTDSTIPTLRLSLPQNPEAAKTSAFHVHETVRVQAARIAVEERPESTSESGWTAYLDQSVDSRHMWNEEDETFLDEESHREDPSMASDASSGPEKPEFARRRCPRKTCDVVVKESQVRKAKRSFQQEEDDLEDTCQSNLSCESVSNDPGPDRRHLKRRRVVQDVLPCSTHVEDPKIEEGHSDENEVEIDAGEAEICSQPPSIGNAVDSRLEVLQHLIPDSHSREPDEEEVLEVAIDYVKSLEKKIKIFEAAVSKRLTAQVAESGKTCLSLGVLQAKPGRLPMVAT